LRLRIAGSEYPQSPITTQAELDGHCLAGLERGEGWKVEKRSFQAGEVPSARVAGIAEAIAVDVGLGGIGDGRADVRAVGRPVAVEVHRFRDGFRVRGDDLLLEKLLR
jgi:hypothetical protein